MFHRMTLVLSLVLASAPLFDVVAAPKCGTKADPCVSLTADFSTLLHAWNDTDFDPTPRYFDVDGQTQGQVATFFTPTLRLRTNDRLELTYRLELGWNGWSRNDPGMPNQFLGGANDSLAARHKEIWLGWSEDGIDLRVGFQRIEDPSRLFVDHHAGALQIGFGSKTSRISFLAAQLPDSTYEGLNVAEDNFRTDTFLFGAAYRRALTPQVALDTALYQVLDRQRVRRPLNLTTAMLGLDVAHGGYTAWFHVLGQTGSWDNSALNETDATILSYALQAGATQTVAQWTWGLNVFAVSADDDYAGNEQQRAFYGSAKNRSRTRLLTEDEMRDRYDNLDERMGTFWGAFVVNPAGLSVADLSLAYRVGSDYHITLVAGTGTTLNQHRSLGSRYVGTEVSLSQTLKLTRSAAVSLTALMFAPGQAASAFINDIDRRATQYLYGGMMGINASF
ncbi:MAG: hypothetical protein ACON3Z_20135 [Bradymonadia bacterium]